MFEIDDVLYPKQDYLLQVYYLFSNFVEYTEGRPLAAQIVAFMKTTLENEGEDTVIAKTIQHFALKEAYSENFERLKANAHLPLKLFLKDDMKTLLLSLFKKGKKVGLLTEGNPVEQLNKLKHFDWQELADFLPQLKVFFISELNFRHIKPLDYIMQEYNVSADEIKIISGAESEYC